MMPDEETFPTDPIVDGIMEAQAQPGYESPWKSGLNPQGSPMVDEEMVATMREMFDSTEFRAPPASSLFCGVLRCVKCEGTWFCNIINADDIVTCPYCGWSSPFTSTTEVDDACVR